MILSFKDDNDNGDLAAIIDLLKERHQTKVATTHGDNITLPGGIKVSILEKAKIEQYIDVV